MALKLLSSSPLISGTEWVDPEDPTVIAETELLGAAASIEAAAKKLEQLKPRAKPKVSVHPHCFFEVNKAEDAYSTYTGVYFVTVHGWYKQSNFASVSVPRQCTGWDLPWRKRVKRWFSGSESSTSHEQAKEEKPNVRMLWKVTVSLLLIIYFSVSKHILLMWKVILTCFPLKTLCSHLNVCSIAGESSSNREGIRQNAKDLQDFLRLKT